MTTHLENQCKKIPSKLLDSKQTTFTTLVKKMENGQGCEEKN